MQLALWDRVVQQVPEAGLAPLVDVEIPDLLAQLVRLAREVVLVPLEEEEILVPLDL